MANTTLTNLPTVINLTGLEPLLGVQSGSSVQITTGQIVSLATGGGGVGPLVVAAGGTGNTTLTQYELLYGDGTNPIQSVPQPTGPNYVLVASPGVAPSWQENIPVTAGVNSVAFGTTGLTPVAATEGNVAIAFGTVPTTAGIYSPATNQIALSTASSQRLLIDASGNVGINNTPSGTYKLEVTGDGLFSTSITTPIVYGGTTASSSLTLQSTSGVGTTDSILMKVGNSGAITALSVASSGIVTIGTLNLTNALSVLYGGTGATTFTSNGVLYGNATSAVGVTTAGTTGQILVATTGSAPTWSSTIPSTAGVTSISFDTTGLTPSTATTGAITVAGTLVAANGGTGQSSYTIGDLLYASGTTALSKLADVAVGSVLVSGGVGTAPAYSSSPSLTTSLTVPIVYGGTGAASSLTLQSTSGAGTTDSIIFKVGNAGAVTALTIGTTGAATFGVSATAPYYIANGATTGSRNQGAFAYGTMGYSDTNVLLSLQSSVNAYNELVIQNTNSGASASTNIIVSNNLGTASTYYGEFGMNSSGFTGTGSLSGVNNVYMASTSSDLVIGTTTANAIRFVTNSGTADALLIRSDGNIAVGNSTGLNTTILSITKTVNPVADTYVMYINTPVTSNAVTNAVGVFSGVYANSGTVNANSIIQFNASPQAGAVGSTSSQSIGFYANDQLSFAASTVSNVWGFYGGISDALDRYNLYMAGSAPNYLASRLGVGTLPLNASVSLEVGGSITGAVSAYGQLNDGQIQPGVTTTAEYYGTAANTAGALFTLTNLIHFRASQSIFGAGSAVTTQTGFSANSNLTGATNNYGFVGNLAAATNNYNLYMAGTANNYFAGYSFGLGGVQYSTTSTATNTATLTAAQIASGFIVGTPTATASYTLPTAASLDTALSNSPTGTNFEFSLITTAAFAITILTAAGWTLVGSMATAATANSFARFRARKTGAGAWTLYRVG